MSNNAIKTFIHDFMESNRPKPTHTHDNCIECGHLTDSWSTNYPKGRDITWRCDVCKNRRREESDELLRKMAKEDPNSFGGKIASAMLEKSPQ